VILELMDIVRVTVFCEGTSEAIEGLGWGMAREVAFVWCSTGIGPETEERE
jgi:hypothetical protein